MSAHAAAAVGTPIIRESGDADLPAVAAIYGHHVRHGFGSFEEVPPDVDELARRWREIVSKRLPYLVASDGTGTILGYAYASPYRTRSAYRFALEDSIYLDMAEIGHGIGRALLADLLKRCTALGYRQMIAVIGGSDQWPSIRLHAALGFTRIGLLPAVGFKFGSWVDSVLMQRALGPGSTTPPQPILIETGGEHG